MEMELAGYRLVGPAVARDGGAVSVPSPGAAAVVCRGIRLADEREVAVKVFAAEDLERAEREAELGHLADHPHILAPIDVVAGVGASALILPWAAGGSLERLLAARRRVPWTEALTILIPLADALASAHERALIHGDISCGNVLFDGDGRPLLADFGAARAATECGMPVAITPCDVAPEIARGADPAPAADLFSLGSVALRCLAGRPAWPADDLRDVLVQSTAGQWPDLEDTMAPPPLQAIVRRLLSPEPDQRGSAGGVAVDLREVGPAEPVDLGGHDGDGTWVAPAAATVVRPDALRPPGLAEPRRAAARRAKPGSDDHGRPGRGRAGRGRERAARGRALARLSALHDPAAPRTTSSADEAPARSRRHHWWRGLAAAAVVAVLAIGAVRVGLWWAGQGTSPPAVAVSPRTPSSATGDAPTGASQPDRTWLGIVAGLDAARSAALTARDVSLLADVYAPGAPARATDARQITEMRTQNVRVRGAAHTIRSAHLVDENPQAVTVRVVASMPSYPIYDSAGATVGRTPADVVSTVVMDLRRGADGFRIAAIRGGGSGGPSQGGSVSATTG